MLSGVRDARQVLAGQSARLLLLGGVSVLSGLAQVLVLVIIVQTSLALSGGQHTVVLHAGPLPELHLRVTAALGAGGVLILCLLVVARMTAATAAALASGVLVRERSALLGSFLRVNPAVQRSGGSGSFQELASSYTSRAAQVAASASGVLVAGINLLVLLFGALLVDVRAAAAVLVGIVLLSFLTQPLARRRRQAARDQASASLEYAEMLGETFASAREVRLFGVVQQVDKVLQARIGAAARPYARLILLQRFAPTAFQYAGFGLLLIALAVLAQDESARLAALGSVMLLVLRSFTYAQALQLSLQQVSEALPYCRRLDEEKLRLTRAADAESTGGREVRGIGTLALESVRVVHPDGRAGLDGVDLVLAPGEAVGLVGPSGSGKTTLVHVLLRLLDPTTGHYRIDGEEARQYDLSSWYRCAAMVPQDAVLIKGNIGENIRFFRTLGQDAVECAARAAGVHDEIMALPHGYDTQLAHNGHGLSGGQRQRLAIARAMAGAPQLLVLDEPTSALDRQSAQTVVAALSKLKGTTTMVIVSHQDTTVAFCDRVVHLEAGRVVVPPRVGATGAR